jgi:hypothetical protein
MNRYFFSFQFFETIAVTPSSGTIFNASLSERTGSSSTGKIYPGFFVFYSGSTAPDLTYIELTAVS